MTLASCNLAALLYKFRNTLQLFILSFLLVFDNDRIVVLKPIVIQVPPHKTACWNHKSSRLFGPQQAFSDQPVAYALVPVVQRYFLDADVNWHSLQTATHNLPYGTLQ